MDRDALSRRTMLALSSIGLAGCTTPDEPTETATTPADLSLDHDVTAWDDYDPDWSAPTDAAEPELEVEVLAETLEIPWDLSFAGNGDLFLTQRTGTVLRYRDGVVTGLFEPEGVIDAGSVDPGSDEDSWFVDGGEGGAMGVAAHPLYPQVRKLYVYYTSETDDGEYVVRLGAFDPESDDPAAPEDVLLEAPARVGTRANIHNGGRLRFGPANYLWVTAGDAGSGELAADPDSLAGSVIRVGPEGEAAPDNEIEGDSRLFSLGHRNPQGLSWLPDATPIENEHGVGPDELNALSVATNYGWPEAGRKDDYADTDYRAPIASSQVEEETWAPSGSTFYTGDGVPTLSNRLLVGCLVHQRLKAFTLTPEGEELPDLGETGVRHDADWLDGEYTVTSHDMLVNELGRIRHVEQGPDGALYAITSNRDGRAKDPFPREIDDVLVRISEA